MTTITEQQRRALVEPFYLQLLQQNFTDEPAGVISDFARSFKTRLRGLDTETTKTLLLAHDWRPNLVGGWVVAVQQNAELARLVPDLLRERKHYGMQGYCMSLAAIPSRDGIAALREHIDEDFRHSEAFDRSSLVWGLAALAVAAEIDPDAASLFESLRPRRDDSDQTLMKKTRRQASRMNMALALLRA